MHKLLVGLGNPGAQYAGTRHNVGEAVVIAWCRAHGVTMPHYGQTATLPAMRATVLRPATYMNVTGPAVAHQLRALGLAPTQLLVVCDDLNLPVGQLRLRSEGSAGGHHGLESVIVAVGNEFPRLRVGIGGVPAGTDGAAYVLGVFTPAERPIIHEAVGRAAAAVDVWLQQDISTAMNQFNRRQNLEDR